MQCPQCRQPMKKETIGETLIDECLHCRGLWFDAGEIDAVKDRLAPPELHWADFDLWRRQGRFEVTYDPLRCPRCADIALTTISERETGATVRFCPKCKGAWLTAADFNAIVNALLDELDRKTVGEYLKDSLKQASILLSTRKDPITDWKDLKAVLRLLKYRFFAENPKLDAVLQGLEKSLPL